MLSSGANVDIQDREGRTALMAAVSNSHANVVETLLRYRANANLFTVRGCTPLLGRCT